MVCGRQDFANPKMGRHRYLGYSHNHVTSAFQEDGTWRQTLFPAALPSHANKVRVILFLDDIYRSMN
jgi:hypothetical protein